MQLYPIIEIQNGRCVSLFRGRLDEPQIWHVDPVKRAREFSEAGAEWLHLTDIDAISGESGNEDLIKDIIMQANMPVQLGGGFRSPERIAQWIDDGAGRIVLGTIATLQPDLVHAAARHHPDQIVLSIDVYKGKVMSHGWTSPSAIEPDDFISYFVDDPLAAIIVTDIDADLGEAEDSLALVTRLAGLTKTPVISRGLVHGIDDISRLKYIPHVSGAMLGRALFDRSIDLDEALALASAPLEKQAEFA